VDYEVTGSEMRVTVDLDAPGGYYSGAVSLTYDGEAVSDDITVSTIPITGGPDTAVLDLEGAGVPEGERTEVFMTVAFDNGVQQQENVEVTWGDVAVDVEILSITEDAGEMVVTASVTTNTTQTVEYEGEINDSGPNSTGGTKFFSGTLEGGAGSFPGDSNTHEARFSLDNASSGTITALTSSGPFDQAQQDWTIEGLTGGDGGDDGGSNAPEDQIILEECSVSQTLNPGEEANVVWDARNIASITDLTALFRIHFGPTDAAGQGVLITNVNREIPADSSVTLQYSTPVENLEPAGVERPDGGYDVPVKIDFIDARV
jgi:hypothetical protein